MSYQHEQFRHVYWIGGGSRAGKSTLARRIAVQYGFQLYETDATMAEHSRRSTPEEQPLLAQFMSMDMDRRWVSRSPETMLDTFPWFQGECFEMILGDLLELSGKTPVLVEGFRLLPRLVRPLLADTRRAVWLLPTPAFRRAVHESAGGSAWDFLRKTSDPERALGNLVDRDRMFTDRLRQETARLGLHAVEVEVGLSEAAVAERALRALGLA